MNEEDIGMMAQGQAEDQGEIKPNAGGLTVSADQLESEITKEMAPEMKAALQQLVDAGNKLMFSKETHSQLFDSIRPEDQVPLSDELGAGAVHLMMMMVQQSKGTMPGEIIIPAGAILLAKACEFIRDTNMEKVSDETFADALHLFATVIQTKLDPSLREKIGAPPDQSQQVEQQPDQQPMDPQLGEPVMQQGGAPVAPQGGLLRQGG